MISPRFIYYTFHGDDMKIAVFGGTFWDVYIYGQQVHKAEVIEMCGGSGLNIAFGLWRLGFDIEFFSNVGSDYRADLILEELRALGFKNNIRKIHGKTGLHIAYNDVPIAVNRGVNELDVPVIQELLNDCDCVFLNGEIPSSCAKKIIELCREKKIFVDVGPLANFDFDLKQAARDILVIGNEKECSRINCDVVKLGPKGAVFGSIKISGDGRDYVYRTGCGDVFDVVLMANLLNNEKISVALNRAVKEAEKMARTVKGAFSKMKNLGEKA